jgi:hypothetical protein
MNVVEAARQVIAMTKAADEAEARAEEALEGEPEEVEGPSPFREPVRKFLQTLPADTVYMVLAIMKLGLEIFNTEEDFFECYDDIRATLPGPEYAIRSLLNANSLVRLLETGLQRLAKIGINVDQLVVR